MHNGVVSNFTAIKRGMCEEMSDAAFASIQGGTDSEHIAALYLTYLTNRGEKETFEQAYSVDDMEQALHDAVATVVELHKKLLGDKAAPNSLNLCATDGNSMVAYRFRNHNTEQPPSLYYSTKVCSLSSPSRRFHTD